MLAEIFMLRLETILRASEATLASDTPSTSSDIRFVPIRLLAISVSDRRKSADKYLEDSGGRNPLSDRLIGDGGQGSGPSLSLKVRSSPVIKS